MKTPIVYTLLSIIFLLNYSPSRSQSPVQQFQANYVTASSYLNSYTDLPNSPGTFSACVTTPYSYTWSNGSANQLKLASFTANSKTYIVAGVTNVQVKLRRINNSTVTGQRTILYSESTAASAVACPTPRTLNFKAPYNHDMASFLNNNVLNHGTDNLFTNSGNSDGNINNIERVDVLFPSGVSSSLAADAGFVLCDRGGNNGHDGFRMAAILSLDGSGNPASFGAAKTCIAGNGTNNGSWGHPSTANGNRQLAAYVLRKEEADPYLKVSSNVNQELGAVFFSLSDLGVAANQVIYGYALLSLDGIASPTSVQLLDTTNTSVYPLNTTEAAGGGLDLISVNTFFGTNQALASSFITSINGSVIQHEGILTWKINDPQSGMNIILERSVNGNNFIPVYSYVHNGSSQMISYREAPGKGKFFYRLRIQYAGEPEYSRIVVLDFNTRVNFSLHPSLARGGEKMQIRYSEEGQFKIRLLTSAGLLVKKIEVTIQGGHGSMKLPPVLATGIYMCVIEKNGLTVSTAQKIYIRR